ncbi:thiolase family protein [Acrocarpospora catenulata]|uniref:thiolase family protein n=1 Tax=Acrocarpospora catenulata TaxID=2836182 RepID=UPI001BDB3227|nr:thiolase family protein [Acrocarpospora catenulata]
MPRTGHGLAVAGVGQTPYRRRHEGSTPELVGQAVREALADAGLTARDVDIVVGGFAPDGLAGENCPDKRFLPAACAIGRWSMRINTGGTTGIAAAYAAMDLLEAGRGDVAVVVGVERMAQANSVPAVFNSIFDPIYERDTGLSTISMGALRATRMMARWGYAREVWAQVAERNFDNASRNPLAQIRTPYGAEDVLRSRMIAWPVTQLDACPVSEGVCAVVIVRSERFEGSGRPLAHVRGRASVSDTYNMGDRVHRPIGNLEDMITLSRSAERAYAQAGISDARQAQVVEIHAPFTHAETMAYGPLRLCDAPDGPDLVRSGFGRWGTETVINPSGGPQAANPVGATALIRLAECAQQVMGSAGERQVPGARVAVATGQGGANQFSTCTVLSA